MEPSSFDIDDLYHYHFRLIDVTDIVNYDKQLIMHLFDDYDVAARLFGKTFAWLVYIMKPIYGIGFSQLVSSVLWEKKLNPYYKHYTWIVTQDDIFIGILMAHTINSNRDTYLVGAFEVYCVVVPHYRNCGIVSELFSSVIDKLKGMLHTEQIVVCIEPDHSIKNFIVNKGEFCDTVIDNVSYGLHTDKLTLEMYLV